MIKSALVATFVGFSIFAMAQTTPKLDLKPYPKAEKGMKQVVIQIPNTTKEDNKKVEIFVGKETETDTCNRYSLMGEFKDSIAQGWGYPYLTFVTKGDVVKTAMACMDNKTTKKFVTSSGYLTDYNSELPIVLYIPSDYTAKYKVYSSDNKLNTANEVLQKKEK